MVNAPELIPYIPIFPMGESLSPHIGREDEIVRRGEDWRKKIRDRARARARRRRVTAAPKLYPDSLPRFVRAASLIRDLITLAEKLLAL